MKIVFVGFIGNIGCQIVCYVLVYGYEFIFIVCSVQDFLVELVGVYLVIVLLDDQDVLVVVIVGYDVFVSVYGLCLGDDIGCVGEVVVQLVVVVCKVGVLCLVVVGGVGSLEVVFGVQLVDIFIFLEVYKLYVLVYCEVFNCLQVVDDLDWIFFLLVVEIGLGEECGWYCV